ncbi:hypothetical protein RHGRI_037493 [Rhododendron griersonianum]|uniref:FBD domain-containing protein n=1 Tax=Rhododendron griersonianum TaxID=479676 RepID=A0AAV6HUQ6_9ERIC|nr:hypothetical protein RHGRI_037493 [Rhododendron griersonianum]
MSSQLNSDLNHPPSPDFDLQSSDSDDYLAFSLRTQPSSKRPRTSGRVLSKRWQYLWTYSTSLVFRDSSDFGDKCVGDFVEFVDKTIVLCTCSKLKKFGVWFSYKPGYTSNVNLWIRFATGRGAEELQLDFDNSEVYEDGSYYLLPQHLYTNSSNASVKKLIPRDIWEHQEEEVEEGYRIDEFHSVIDISAPHLHLLGISGRLGDKIYRLGNVSSLVDSILNFHERIDSDDSNDYERYSNMLGGLLQSLLHVKKMTLGNWAIENLLTHSLFAALLLQIPGLCNFDEKHYWTSKYRFFRCLMFCLKKVEFIGLVGSELDLYLSFVQFILENAMVLQKMVIDKLMESCQWKEEFVRATQKLLSFPRSSRNAVVLFYP